MTQVLQKDPIQIFYPNGGTSAAQMYIWSTSLSEPVIWDGTVAVVIAPPAAPTTIITGHKTIATAGSQAALAASTVIQSVTVKALTTNTGLVVVGDSSVDINTGFQLRAGESVSMDIANLATVFIDVAVNGEGVSYLAVN